MKAYDISSTCIQFQTRILDVFVANKSIQLKYSIQCCALGLKFLSFPLTLVSLERKIRKLSPVAKERERNTRENISTTKNLFSLRTVSNHIHRGTKVCAILIFLFYFTHSVNVFIHFTHFFSRIFRWLPMTRSLRTDFVANAHRSALTCTLVNTRIIAKPRNRETWTSRVRNITRGALHVETITVMCWMLMRRRNDFHLFAKCRFVHFLDYLFETQENSPICIRCCAHIMFDVVNRRWKKKEILSILMTFWKVFMDKSYRSAFTTFILRKMEYLYQFIEGRICFISWILTFRVCHEK